MAQESRDRKKPRLADEELLPCPRGCDHPGFLNVNGVRGHMTLKYGITAAEAMKEMAIAGLITVQKVKKGVGVVKSEDVPEVKQMEDESQGFESVVTGLTSSVNDVISFRGKLRQYATRLGETEGTAQFKLIPQREFLKYAQ